MKRLSLLLLGLFISLSCFSQIDFLTEKRNIQQVKELERNINSMFIGFDTIQVAQDYFPGAVENKSYFPLKFKRTNDTFFPELFVEYFYDEGSKDSTIVCTSYDWDIMSYVKNLNVDGHYFDTQIKREKEYLQKYKEIKSSVINKLGRPDNIDESKGDDGYFYKLEWFGDNTDVVLLFSFSKKLKSLGKFKLGSYRIRLKVDYK